MDNIYLLKNSIQPYAWGSRTAIAELLGTIPPADDHQAELWLGAHPKASSMVKVAGAWTSLSDLLDNHPEKILGESVSRRFKGKLPYLFKVLAVEKPLSIQAHPNLYQARDGFSLENRLGIPLDAENRNYRDDNHKPECICALTPFLAMAGFRDADTIHTLMEKICPRTLKPEVDDLKQKGEGDGLKDFFRAMMTMEAGRADEICKEGVASAKKISGEDPVFEWVVTLSEIYPGDMGVFSPLFLNFVRLEPGQALYLPAGQLHAYLEGLGIELMANSDNVLRGGLTPKHIDVPELLKVIDFQSTPLDILVPHPVRPYENLYETRADEFDLSVITVAPKVSYRGPEQHSAEIFLCTEGRAVATAAGSSGTVNLAKGVSVLIPASTGPYTIHGDATLYKAGVPVRSYL